MSETFLPHQDTFLHLLLQHAPLQDIFALIDQMAEDRVPGIKCVINIHDVVQNRSRCRTGFL